jgi:chromosome segregation protein
MFLKSLSMKGFKSFADPTVLEFESGVTVVVGPNGSGKSNVVDAVTWVLGAQGPRSLRSQKMEDVIFAGTSSRAALGRAEVSLTIDNGSGKLPVDMAEVTITRTLFRSGDSEYAINGTPCRLLDIQDLLSDSGVGRQQHMIIGQGQLDTVLNARPEDRRAIIEEAAGVLKHRRRRERAERRLTATAENLERLGDLVREVRRQIRPLERQAAAARSFTTVADDLRAVRRYLAGAELTELGERRQKAADALVDFAAEETDLDAVLAALDAEATETAAELSSRREEDLATALGRVQGLVERTRGTAGVLRERSRALLAALDAAADVDVVSTLEAEAARLAAELVAAGERESELDPERDELARTEGVLQADVEAHHEQWGDGSELQAAEELVAQVRARLELATQALAQERAQQQDLDGRLTSLRQRATEMDEAARALATQATQLSTEADRLRDVALATEATATEAANTVDELQGRADVAEQARHRTAARAEALERALQDLQGAGGKELLDGVDGVVGSLVDLVEIDHGWEAAFEAAAGAAVAAVVVEGRQAAHEALGRLRAQGVTGAILAPRGAGNTGNGGLQSDAGLPGGAEPLRRHIRARGGSAAQVADVLDSLVGRAVRVSGWEEAIDLSLDRPDLVVVTTEGDRFAASGWRVRSSKGVVTAAAVEEAERRAVEAAEAADQLKVQLAGAREIFDRARQSAIQATRAADRSASELAGLEAEQRRSAADRVRLDQEVSAADASWTAIEARVEAGEATVHTLTERLPELEGAALGAVTRAAEAAEAWSVLESRTNAARGLRQELEVRAAGLIERRGVLGERLAEVERRLEGHAEEREQAAERRQRLESDGRALARLERIVVAEQERLVAVLDELRQDYRLQVEAVRAGGERLETLRQNRHSTERRLGEVRDKTRALDLEAAEVTLRTDALAESIRRELSAEPADVVGAPCPELPEGTTATAYATKLADTLAALGPVNPLALEELSVLEDRHKELDTQVDDVRAARRELQEVVRTLDEEIMQSFASAAADVNEHFSTLVAMLFPGGMGRLVLTEPDDLLNTGVEIEVRPAGRNVRRVSLLSGGERSLAALAFLFAVFRSRPSPFYLMDEVEAALDDVNLHRFLGLVREFRHEAQLIIVSHQKRTMETGDALYGVTMAPGGSSQVVSQKVERAGENDDATGASAAETEPQPANAS